MRVTAGVHSVREALRARRPLEKVLVAKGAASSRLQEIIELCRENGIPVRFESRDSLDRAANGVPHQGVVAFGSARAFNLFEDVIENARLLVILDGIEDPHNLGAIIRTAHAAGSDAVILPERRSASLTETVERTSAGALEYLPVARVTNVTQTLERLKQKGFWVYGLDERGASLYDQTQYAIPTVFVLGAEGKGLHQLVQRHCDSLIRIPMSGAIASLNVSVAAGIVLFEWRKQQSH